MPEPPATLSPADRDALVLRLQRDDARDPATLAALAALAPDDALAVLERARFPQYMARVVASQPTRLRDALYRPAELAVRGGDTHVRLAGLLALHRAAGTTLEPRFDPWLAEALRTWWADDVHAIWRDALLTLPAARREALVCPPADGPIAWRYLRDASSSSAALERAVRAAAQLTSTQPDPPARYTPPVYGLANVGDAAVPHLVAALGADRASTPVGRRVLTAALAWSTSRGGVDALRTLALDADDADVRRLARDGLAARGIAPPDTTASTPTPVAALHAHVTDALRRAMHACARTVDAATRDGRMPWRDAWRGIALPTAEPLLAALALADLWHDSLRAPPGAARYFAPGVLLAGLRYALAEHEASLAPWCLAEIACRVPYLPAPVLAVDELLRDLPPQLERDVAQALGQQLTPDDCGNPVSLYDWLAAHHAGQAPAFARGLATRGVDPRVTRICQRALAASPGHAPSATTLQEIVDAFALIAEGCRFGWFELFAIDRVSHRGANADPSGRAQDDPAAAAAVALALQRLADAPSTSIADTAARFLTSLGAAGLRMPDRAATPDDPVCQRTCDAARKRLGELIVSDTLDTTRSDATANATRLFASLGEGAACVEVRDIADVAFSVGLVAQDRTARFAVLIAYVNDQ